MADPAANPLARRFRAKTRLAVRQQRGVAITRSRATRAGGKAVEPRITTFRICIRRVLADLIRRNSVHYGETKGQLEAAREALARQTTADHFGAQKVQQGFAVWGAAWERFFDQFSGTLVDALAQLPAGDRRKLLAERRMIGDER